jgi:hypothetical protein
MAAGVAGVACAALAPAPLLAAEVKADGPPEAKMERLVGEDDQVRIEELRVRGETQRIVVKLKGSGGREYEIVPSTGAADPSQRLKAPAGSALWRLFSF